MSVEYYSQSGIGLISSGLRGVLRFLRPSAPFIVSFSKRYFPAKAVAIWRSLDTGGHADLIRLYLERAAFRDISAAALPDSSQERPH